MIEIERAEEVMEAAARMDRMPTPEEVAFAQAQATLSIAKSLDFICCRMSDEYANGNRVTDAIYHLAGVLSNR